MDINERIKEQLNEHDVLLYMKGTPDFPQCGFSAATVKVFQQLDVSFESADILADPEKRQAIKEFSSWPTIGKRTCSSFIM